MSFAWIIANRALYSSFTDQRRVLHISPLADQQAAGYIAKLGTFSVLWTIAYIKFSKMPNDETAEQSELRWIDVERSLDRAERRGQFVKETETKQGEAEKE